jgi:hypothetical protein
MTTAGFSHDNVTLDVFSEDARSRKDDDAGAND